MTIQLISTYQIKNHPQERKIRREISSTSLFLPPRQQVDTRGTIKITTYETDLSMSQLRPLLNNTRDFKDVLNYAQFNIIFAFQS